ncbi:MAG: ribonuclease H-like domain-containing protein [Bacillaceae bacterium]|nr:ribonuclease H-like domain-containing protein [Bacillaceae bacterium]
MEKWAQLGVTPFYFDGQYSLIREVVYPLDVSIGNHKGSALIDVAKRWNTTEINHPLSCKNNHVSEMIFFDTETTGLNGGTGTYIFLLGYARVLEDRVIVRQHLLPDPSCEVAFYQGFLREVGESIHLATSYNGKAFDWPHVKTRHTFVRDQVPKLPQFGHFDLLHAARRLWKEQLPSCRLSIVEEQILGLKRHGDTPGSLAPFLYFDFLKERDPDILEGILRHHEQDVLSLISLYVTLSLKILGFDTEGTFEEKYGIAKWFQSLKENDQAVKHYKQSIMIGKQTGRHLQAMYALARVLKKQKKYEEAKDFFIEVTNVSNINRGAAYIELAKLYEHHDKNLALALRCSEKAYEYEHNKLTILRRKDQKTLEGIQSRIDRLKKRL